MKMPAATPRFNESTAWLIEMVTRRSHSASYAGVSPSNSLPKIGAVRGTGGTQSSCSAARSSTAAPRSNRQVHRSARRSTSTSSLRTVRTGLRAPPPSKLARSVATTDRNNLVPRALPMEHNSTEWRAQEKRKRHPSGDGGYAPLRCHFPLIPYQLLALPNLPN